MSNPSASYPASIWDGKSTSRTESRDKLDKAPDYEDWDRLVSEVIAMQNDTVELDGDNVAVVPNASSVGDIPVIHRIDVADVAGDTDVVLTYKTRIIDVVVIKTVTMGGFGDTITVKNGTTPITNDISLSLNDQWIGRVSSIDDASHEIAAGGTLRLTTVKGTTSVSCIVYVYGILVP